MKKIAKKFLAVFLLVAMVLVGYPTVNAQAVTVSTVTSWFDSKNGKALDFDGASGYQCVDFFNYYLKEVWGISSPISQYPVDYAYQIYDYSAPSGWTKISGSGNYQVGDIVIWNKSSSNKAGHVGMVYSTSGTVKIIEQNYGGQYVAIHDIHSTSLIRGVFRPPLTDTCTCSTSYAGTYTCTTSSLPLTIRSGHGTSYSSLGSIPSGASVTVTKANGTWAHVTYNGISGYASMEYLTKKVDTTALSISSSNKPGTITQGDSFNIAGTISSGSKITNVTAGVYDREGTMKTGKSVTPNATSYSLGKISSSLAFDDLSAGIYNYKVTATNSAGTSKTLVSKTFVVLSTSATVSDGTYFLRVASASDWSVDVPGHVATSGTDLQLKASANTQYQAFQATYVSDGYYMLKNVGSGLYLDVSDGASTKYTTVQQYSGNSSDAQLWQILPIVGGGYCLVPKCATSLCLDVYDGKFADGSVMQIYTANLTNAQIFTLTKSTGLYDESAVSGVAIGGRAADALRINWTKDSSADGYIIEQYKNGSWTRIARIADASTTTYRVSGLSAGTTYQFRIKAFTFDSSSNAVYSAYTTISGKTNPSAVSGLKVSANSSTVLQLNWTKNTTASGYIIEQYKGGTWTRIARIADNGTVSYSVTGLSAGTTYKFRIKAFAYDGSTPIYSTYQTVSGTTNQKVAVSAVSGLKIGGRATDALRLNWDQNSSAGGYIVEQYISGAWTRIARIADNSTTTYRVGKLTAATTYQFRVMAFAFDGTTPVYSTYQSISGTTLPSAVTGLKIGGTATDALRLNWTKSIGASGYIIEQYKNGSWTRIARIASGDTVTYRVENLESGTEYVFRVQSFAFDGSTPLYSSWVMITGKTN